MTYARLPGRRARVAVGVPVASGRTREAFRVLQGDDPRPGGRQLGQPVHELVLSDDDPHAGVLDHVAEALFRVFGGQRQVGAAGPQDPPYADHQVDRRLYEEPHTFVEVHAELPQVPAEGRAALRELAEGQPPLSADDRRGVGAQPGLSVEQIGKTGVLG